MTAIRCRIAGFALVLIVVSVIGPQVGAAADDFSGGNDNAAVAVNTEDGASVFRLAFSVRMVANGVVDQTNSAYALASCTDCQTVALAFQVVLVWGDPNVAVPHNRALAYNDQCVECVTYASATQIVLGFDGPVRFTDEGRRRLRALYELLSGLEERAGDLTVAQLHAEVTAAKAELLDILSTQLVEANQMGEATAREATAGTSSAPTTTGDGSATSTSSTTVDGAASSTTIAGSTTGDPATTSTTPTTTTATTTSSSSSTSTSTSSTSTSTPTTAPTTTAYTAAP